MPDEQLTAAALALSLPDRIALAEALWDSIEAEQIDLKAHQARRALQKHQGTSPNSAEKPSIQEVIEAARRITGRT